jgi:hypothetical protein
MEKRKLIDFRDRNLRLPPSTHLFKEALPYLQEYHDLLSRKGAKDDTLEALIYLVRKQLEDV